MTRTIFKSWASVIVWIVILSATTRTWDGKNPCHKKWLCNPR